MNDSPYDGSNKFGGPSYQEKPGSYKFDANPAYDDISSTQPTRSSAIDLNAEARSMGIGAQTDVNTDKNLQKILGENSSVNLMDVLSGNVNLNINELANLMGATSSATGVSGVSTPTTSTPPPTSTPTPSPSVALSLTTALAAEIKKLKATLKNQETVNDMQKDQINMVQDAVNKMAIQDSKVFDENAVMTVSSQSFFFDLRKSEASSPPSWT